jgi:hypothetical protein
MSESRLPAFGSQHGLVRATQMSDWAIREFERSKDLPVRQDVPGRMAMDGIGSLIAIAVNRFRINL